MEIREWKESAPDFETGGKVPNTRHVSRPRPASNMAKADPYSLGMVLNEEMRHAWMMFHTCRKLAKNTDEEWLKRARLDDANHWHDVLIILCRIRRAGRIGI